MNYLTIEFPNVALYNWIPRNLIRNLKANCLRALQFPWYLKRKKKTQSLNFRFHPFRKTKTYIFFEKKKKNTVSKFSILSHSCTSMTAIDEDKNEIKRWEQKKKKKKRKKNAKVWQEGNIDLNSFYSLSFCFRQDLSLAALSRDKRRFSFA